MFRPIPVVFLDIFCSLVVSSYGKTLDVMPIWNDRMIKNRIRNGIYDIHGYTCVSSHFTLSSSYSDAITVLIPTGS